MITANLNNLELMETWTENSPSQRVRVTFPLAEALGSENSTLVYFELAPGNHLGRHADSTEEVILILDGTVEVSVGEEQGLISQGELALVPRMAPHNLRNAGDKTAKILGFFGSPNIVATFDEIWLPYQTRIIDTAAIFAQMAQ